MQYVSTCAAALVAGGKSPEAAWVTHPPCESWGELLENELIQTGARYKGTEMQIWRKLSETCVKATGDCSTVLEECSGCRDQHPKRTGWHLAWQSGAIDQNPTLWCEILFKPSELCKMPGPRTKQCLARNAAEHPIAVTSSKIVPTLKWSLLQTLILLECPPAHTRRCDDSHQCYHVPPMLKVKVDRTVPRLHNST